MWQFQGNMIVATESCASGISVRSESSPMDQISVRDNHITVDAGGKWRFGIRVAATSKHEVGHVSVTGNSIRSADSGVAFEGPGFRQTPVCALNQVAGDVPVPISGIGNLPFDSVIVGGCSTTGGASAGSGGGRFLAGLGDPNHKVTGNVKETGDGTNTGWMPK